MDIGDQSGAVGSLAMAGGKFSAHWIKCGLIGTGQMTVSGTADLELQFLTIGESSGGQNAITVLSGSLTAAWATWLGYNAGANGSLAISDGQANLGGCEIGLSGTGAVTVAGGTLTAGITTLGRYAGAAGSVAISGGTSFIGQIAVGVGAGQVSVTGGALVASGIGLSTGSIMVADPGVVSAGEITLGYSVYSGVYSTSGGSMEIGGGTVIATKSLIIGDCAHNAPGAVSLNGGVLYVTNSTHTAFLDVRDGTLTLNAGGTLIVDILIVTNSCGSFVDNGGTVQYRQLVLAPDTPPLRLSPTPSGTSLTISWPAAYLGYVLQESTDLAAGPWTDVGQPPTLVGTENQIIVSPLLGNRFYRLKR
jgi:hypothetical protein